MISEAIPKAISPARLGELVMGTRVVNGREVPKYKRNPFVNRLNRELMALAAGEFENLGVFGPPRHGKTLTLNVLFAAWFLGNFPDRQVIAASHSAKLASKFGLQVRDILKEYGPSLFGVTVRSDREAVDNWELTAGGGMLSIGVGGSLVGFGADLLIMDDIIADSKAALSEVTRNNTIDWYQSTAETRINSGGIQVFTMQRWHGDDPAQRIVFDNAEDWRIVNIPAIADHDPALGESDPLGRQPGEALWPERYPLAKLEKLRARKPFWFAAQYQQTPVPRGGGMFQSLWIEEHAVWYRPVTDETRIRYWDCAATEGDGDYTVGALMSCRFNPKDQRNEFYIEDVVRGQWGSGNRDRVIRQTCEQDNARYPHGVITWREVSPGDSGKDAGELFVQKMAPFPAHYERPTGDKAVRADGLASAFSVGSVHVCKGLEDNKKADKRHPWYDALLAEFALFPHGGKHDDIVDACSGAFGKLTLGEEPCGFATLDPREYAAEMAGEVAA